MNIITMASQNGYLRRSWPATFQGLIMAIVLMAVLSIALTRAARASDYPGTVSIWATMGEFSPTLVRIITGKPYPSATSSLNAGSPTSYNPPPPSSDESEGKLSPIYTWTWQVNYKSSEGASYASAPSADYAVNPIPASSLSAATWVFVPKIPAYWQVSVTGYVTVTDENEKSKTWDGHANAGPRELTSYTFDITYTGSVAGGKSDSGSVVSNQTTDVHAGWPIKLGAKITPSDLATQFTWMISGAGGNGAGAIGGYTPIAGATSVTPLAASNAATDVFPGSATPSGAYYYTTNNKFAASVAPTNNAEIPYVMTTFDVAKPTATVSTVTDRVNVWSIAGVMMFGGWYSDPAEPEKDGGADGIDFTYAPVQNTGFSGEFDWIQVYTPDWSFWNASGKLIDTLNGSGLDSLNRTTGGVFYGNNPPEDSPYTSPNFISNDVATKIAVADHATMWLMYLPKAAGSIWVPIDSVNWNWGGTDTLVNNSWSLSNGSWSRNPTGAETNIFPIWNGYANLSPTQK